MTCAELFASLAQVTCPCKRLHSLPSSGRGGFDLRRMDHECFIDEDAAHGIRHGVLRELVAHFLKNAYIDPRFIFVVLRDKIGIELDPQDHLFGIGAKDMLCFEE